MPRLNTKLRATRQRATQSRSAHAALIWLILLVQRRASNKRKMASSVRMNDFWDRMKRETRDAIRESGRPDLMLAIFSGLIAIAWALVAALRLFVAALQSY